MKFRSLSMVLATCALLIGCDQSKPELEKTKQELATVTTERDNLKSQLDQANSKVASLDQQVTQCKSQMAAATPPPDEKKAGKGAKGGKAAKGSKGGHKKGRKG